MKKLLVICLMFLFLVGTGSAVNYNFYFSDDNAGNLLQGSDSNPCTIAQPCKNLNKTQDLLDSLESTDSATFWFDSGDTWDVSKANRNSFNRITNWSSARDGVLWIERGSVIFTSYGSGSKPVFDGGTDFVSNPLSSVRQSADCIIMIKSSDCMIQNIEIKNHFGQAIGLWETGIHNTTIERCYLHNLGKAGINGFTYLNFNNTIQYNEIAYSQRSEELGYTVNSWSGGIHFQGGEESGFAETTYGNLIRYNYVHHIYGEGIVMGSYDNVEGLPSIIEYNLIGDTNAPAIHVPPTNASAGKIIVRHNLIFSTPSAGYGAQGIYLQDEVLGGDNSGAEYSIYGNTIIGRERGINLNTGGDDPDQWGKVYIYNNAMIDCNISVFVSEYTNIADLRFFNNFAVHYGTSQQHVYDLRTNKNGVVDNNLFYGSILPSISPWTNGMKTGDPLLSKTSGWRLLSGPPSFNDFSPQLGSALIDSGLTLGAGFDDTFLTSGTDFDSLPQSAIFVLNNQDSEGSGWDIGSVVYEFGGETNCVHEADLEPCDGKVSRGELDNYVVEWKSNSGVTLVQVIEAIGIWKSGGY